MNTNSINAAQGAPIEVPVLHPDIQQAINPIEEEPGALGQERKQAKIEIILPPLGQREASLKNLKNPDQQIYSTCVDLIHSLTDLNFTHEEKMAILLATIIQTPELLLINSEDGRNILMVSMEDVVFFESMVEICLLLLEEDIDNKNACALCGVLLQQRRDNGKNVLSVAIDHGNTEIVEYVRTLYDKLASIQQTSCGNSTLDVRYKELQASTGPSLKNARNMVLESASC